MNPKPNSRRGSILVVAMLFGTLMVVALSSYVALNTHSLKMANRSFYASEAMNMAESGLEEAVWSFNQAYQGEASAWNGWSISGTAATRTFTDFTLGTNATGFVKVYVDNYNPAPAIQPNVIAESTVTLPNSQGRVSRMVEIKMRRRSYFAAGLVAKNAINFTGNTASVDSWVSDPDNDASTAAVPYGSSVRRDKGSIGATSVTATISVGNADIWGTASVGGSTATNITVGSNGRVGPFSTGAGIKDPNSVASDFNASLDIVSNPTTGTVLASIGSTIGTEGTTTVWRTASCITSSLTVYGNVTLILTAGAGVDAIDIAGSDGITLAPGATLTIYTEGDVKIAGNGLANPNDRPDAFQLWGTSTSTIPQDIQIAGNGALKGVIYAPNANVRINGNGDVMGAIVGQQITLDGTANFHYDESLGTRNENTPFGITKWRELLTPTDRAVYASNLAF
ncbi:MAG: hypothetical protein Q7S40_08955 [Opitutaceae bacterium]|nr:hypothetical protein [Opitutaceae bacterium]